MSAYDYYSKIRDVITHEGNNIRHIPAINKLIRNYENKFPEEDELIKSLGEYVFDLEKILKRNMNDNKTLVLGLSAYDKEDPMCIKIIPTSWSSPQTYHVIIEDGEFSKIEYLGEHTKETIKQIYEIDIDGIEDSISQIIRENSNDQDLGKKIRKIYTTVKPK